MSGFIRTAFLYALLIRILIAPLFYHPDIKSQHFHFQFFGQGVFNIYQYLDVNKSHLPYTDTFNYLPLTYLTFGTFQKIISPILGQGFFLWLNDWGPAQYRHSNFMFYLFVLKIPYLVSDIFIGFILYKLIKDPKILYLWFFNPFSIYLIYILGNFDVIPVLATFISYWLIKSNRPILGYLALGCAVALKMYPLLFLPFFLFLHPVKVKSSFRNILIMLIPFLITIIPYIFNSSFSQAFIGSGLTQKLLEIKISGIPIFPIFYLITLLFFYRKKTASLFPKTIFLIFLAFVSTVNYHPQWILWFLPFVLIYFYQTNRSQKMTVLLSLVLSIVFVFMVNDHFLFWGHLTPINSSFVLIPSPYDLLVQKIHLNPPNIQHIIQSILALLFIRTLAFHEKNI